MRHALLAGGLAIALLASPAAADGLEEVQAGNAAFGAGRYQAAVEAYTRGILAGDLEPEALAIALNNRGVAYGELGDYDRSIGDYEEALKLHASDATAIKNLRIAHTRRGSTAASLGETEAALADYGEAIELDPNHPMAYLRRGQLRLHAGDVAGAISDLETARRLDPNNQDATALLQQAAQARAAAAPTPPAGLAALAPEPAAGAAPAEPVSEAVPDEAVTTPAPPTAAAVDEEGAPAGPGRPFRAVADVNVRSGPGNNFPTSSTLARGTTVSVLGERLGWLRIRMPDGGEGFVYRKWLSALDGAGSP